MRKKDAMNMISEQQKTCDGFSWYDASRECIGTGSPSFVSSSWTVDGKQYNARVSRSELALRWRAMLESDGKTVWKSNVLHDTPEQAIDELQRLASGK